MDESYVIKGIAVGIFSYFMAMKFGIWVGVAAFWYVF